MIGFVNCNVLICVMGDIQWDCKNNEDMNDYCKVGGCQKVDCEVELR